MRKVAAWIIVVVMVALPAVAAFAIVDNQGFSSVQAIFSKSCADCHDWTGSWEGITGGGRIVAGAASTDQPIVVAAEAPGAAAPARAATFLLFPDKVTFHAVTGFTSTGLLLAAGVVGGIHFLNMMSAAHTYRDSIGFMEGGPEAVRAAEIDNVWAGDSTLRWWHVGLLISGETLYLGDALTGISMFTTQQPGKLTKHDIHRYAFFTHAALMVAQIGLGFAETYALSTGQHDLMAGIGAAHVAIGLTIPLVMLGAGLENLLLTE